MASEWTPTEWSLKPGRASRDAEIAAGDELVESLRDALKYQRGLVASLDVDRDSLRQQLAEREALVERMRTVRAQYPECDVHPEDDVIQCGWKRIVIDMDAALGHDPVSVLAERDAVIERVREWRDENQAHLIQEATNDAPEECSDDCEWCPLDDILAASPSTVLAEHDARVLEEFAVTLRERYPEMIAAAIRAAALGDALKGGKSDG